MTQEYIPKGAPRKFSQVHCEIVRDCGRNGYSINKTIQQLYEQTGIVRDTYYRWIKEEPDFKAAVEQAAIDREVWWEDLGTAIATGAVQKANPTVYIYRTNAMFGWQKETKVSSDNIINIHNLQINSLSDTELNKHIENIQKKIAQLEFSKKEEV